MKILYGIQATGNGHISRSRMLAKYFNQHKIDVEVQYLFSGRDPQQLFDMEAFGEFWHRQGLTFVTQNGQVDYLKSAFHNNLFRFLYDVINLPVDNFDLLITDFEPVTAWAAKLHNKPVIGIGHQYAFGENTPVTGANFIAKSILKNFAPAKKSVGLHWHAFDNNILPPIIDTQLQTKTLTEHNNIIVVYLPFESQTAVTQLLQHFPQWHFIQYAPDVEDKNQANVSLRKVCYQGFKNDLCQARGVICNSGFELISECLHLSLPILTKPIKGQMEQLSNAHALAQLKFATIMHELCEKTTETWLATINNQENTVTKIIPDVAKALVNWILNDPEQPIEQLSTQLWKMTH